jgi:hypothetical protein
VDLCCHHLEVQLFSFLFLFGFVSEPG